MRRDSDAPAAFQEDDFRQIAAWGFNFVRLPMTYEHWVDPSDWTKVDEAKLAPIDQAVAWGRQYGLHVSLNFHRAPGYCVNPPAESRTLWTDTEARRACAAHWRVFARRYRDVPSSALSFNLLNEPPYGLSESTYRDVAQQLITAIRAEDPSRLVLIDGLDAGRRPALSLAGPGRMQATRGYEPLSLTHYLANWAPGNDRLPVWPPATANTYLYGPWRPDQCRPLEISGPFPAGELVVTVNTVTDFASLHVALDGVPALDEDFLAGKGDGAEPPRYLTEWRIHQTVYNRTVSLRVPAGTRRIRIEVGNGDWLTLSEVAFRDAFGQRALLPLAEEWGQPQPAVRFCDMTLLPDGHADGWLRRRLLDPWQPAIDAGIPVMVGEWGVYHKTPHAVTLRWMEDCLRLWQAQGWGWALWNFRGPFGVLDSGRTDVRYTPFGRHQLDTQMLKLLQRY